jgi:hypothetical protein
MIYTKGAQYARMGISICAYDAIVWAVVAFDGVDLAHLPTSASNELLRPLLAALHKSMSQVMS